MINSFIRITSSLDEMSKAFQNGTLVLIDIRRELTLLQYEMNRRIKLVELKKLQIKLNNFQS